MIPTSISASSLEAFRQCPARYKATAIDRGAGFNNPAALLGTTLHGALEAFTEPMQSGERSWDWNFLFECYVKSFKVTFGHDQEDDWFEDGRQILAKWYSRSDQQSDIQDITIISREVKENFPVPYIAGDGSRQFVPLNYIIDRLDQLDDDVFRVVDYKSQRSPLSPDDLKYKVQPRIYALAVQIKYPHAREIWVQYDFLRYDRVATLFTRDDNAVTWRNLKQELQAIIDTPDSMPPEVLNENCRYCPRRFTCRTLQSNVSIGGIFSLSVDELALRYYSLKGQVEALKSTVDDMEHALLNHASEMDQLEWETDAYKAKVTASKRRVIDRQLMAEILGPELMKDYGRLNVGDIDLLRRDPRLTPAQASLLNTAISTKLSDPTVRVTKR